VKTTIEDRGPWRKAIAITIDPEDVEREMDRVVASYRTRAVVPGFRKGKVPDQIVRSQFRGSLESDLLNHILPEATERAIAEHKLQPAGTPHIQDLRFRSGEPLTFTAVVDVWPEIEARDYRGIEVEETVLEVDDEMVDEFLGLLRERAATLTPLTRPAQEGDVVEASVVPVDFQGKRLPRGKRQIVKMEAGGPTLLPEFREASLGVEPGAEKIVRITYPQDFGDEALAGQTRHYRMHVKAVLEKQLPDLDDAFAENVDGVASLEALRAKIRLRLETDERLRARDRTEQALVGKLIERNPFDLPPGLVESSLQRGLEKAREERPGLDEEEFRQTYGPLVERMRRRDLLLEAIGRQEGVSVTDEDLLAELARSAAPGVDPQVVRRKLERDGELDRVREDLRERKVLDFLLEQATIQRTHQPRPRKSNLILP